MLCIHAIRSYQVLVIHRSSFFSQDEVFRMNSESDKRLRAIVYFSEPALALLAHNEGPSVKVRK